MPTLTLQAIEDLCKTSLLAVGASEEQAAIVAEEIADAEAEGIRNVGLGYIHLYLKHLKVGKVKPHAQPRIVKTSAAATVVDADFGFCHHAYMLGEARLIETAREQGVAMLSINQSSSAGVLGWFVRRLAREGLVSLMFANSSKAVAAHGGKVPFFGTNPFAVAAPRAGEEPLVVDMATSSTARSLPLRNSARLVSEPSGSPRERRAAASALVAMTRKSLSSSPREAISAFAMRTSTSAETAARVGRPATRARSWANCAMRTPSW